MNFIQRNQIWIKLFLAYTAYAFLFIGAVKLIALGIIYLTT
jgi:hypothetical protein